MQNLFCFGFLPVSSQDVWQGQKQNGILLNISKSEQGQKKTSVI